MSIRDPFLVAYARRPLLPRESSVIVHRSAWKRCGVTTTSTKVGTIENQRQPVPRTGSSPARFRNSWKSVRGTVTSPSLPRFHLPAAFCVYLLLLTTSTSSSSSLVSPPPIALAPVLLVSRTFDYTNTSHDTRHDRFAWILKIPDQVASFPPEVNQKSSRRPAVYIPLPSSLFLSLFLALSRILRAPANTPTPRKCFEVRKVSERLNLAGLNNVGNNGKANPPSSMTNRRTRDSYRIIYEIHLDCRGWNFSTLWNFQGRKRIVRQGSIRRIMNSVDSILWRGSDLG